MMLVPFKNFNRKKRLFLKRNHFFFGKNLIANIVVKSTRSNIFLTLTDLQHKVVIARSAGCCISGNNKKKKTNPYTIDTIIRFIFPILKLYKIKFLNIIFKTYSISLCPFLLKSLNIRGLKILKTLDSCAVPHNGVRLRKIARK